MKASLITLFLLHLVFFGFSQEIGYEVRGTYKRPIAKETLNVANTVSDINPGYPSSWIARYFSVEILATCNGIVMKALSANDTLSNEQKNILKMADLGTDIVVDVKYSTNNSSKDDLDVKVINFSYSLIPETEAQYQGGYQNLKQYLKENAIDKISKPFTNQLFQTIVRFTVNEDGQVVNAHLTKASEDKNIDKLLLETISNMPNWKPAENAKGVKVKQEFELMVGQNIGC